MAYIRNAGGMGRSGGGAAGSFQVPGSLGAARLRLASTFSTPAPKSTGIGSAVAIRGVPVRGGGVSAAGAAALIASALLPKLVGSSVEESKLGLGIAGSVIAPGVASQQIGGFLADKIGRPSIMGTPRNDSTPQVFTRTPAINQTRPSVLSTPAVNESAPTILSTPSTQPNTSNLINLMNGESSIAIVGTGGEARYPNRPSGSLGKRLIDRFINRTYSRNVKRWEEATKGTPAEGTPYPDEFRLDVEQALKMLAEQVNHPGNKEFLQRNLKDDNASVAGHGPEGIFGPITGVYGQAANQLEASARQAYGQAGKNIKTWDQVFKYAQGKEEFAGKTIKEIAELTGAAHKLGKKL